MKQHDFYPLTAIVGQEPVKRALLLAAVNRRAGGLLIGGPRGTAKSTLVRGLEGLTGVQKRVDLPLNATEDRVFGGLDVEYAVAKGKRRFAPGILARAHENILYIDEVNLLSRELLIAVLDSSTAEYQRVEREGLSVQYPVCTTVIGTMNPDEGALSAAILDRFGLYASTADETDPARRQTIVRRRLAFERDRRAFRARFRAADDELAARIAAARALVGRVEVGGAMMELAAQLCARAYAAGHRAELYLLEAAKAAAALDGRAYILPRDVEEAAQFVLPHRRREAPAARPEPPPPEPPRADEAPSDPAAGDPPPEENGDAPTKQEPEQADGEREHEQAAAPNEQTAAIDRQAAAPPLWIDPGRDRVIRRGSGKRSLTRTDRRRGRYVRAALPQGKITDLAFDATIRTAAPYQRLREKNGCAVRIEKADLRRKIREKRVGGTILFLVDASGSMGANMRMKVVKGTIFALLQEAYQKRDKVGLIAFRRDCAEALLPVTRSVELAQKCLRELPTGGKTPLAEGLTAALAAVTRLRRQDREQEPVLVLVTDGRANAAGAAGGDPVAAALAAADKIGAAAVPGVVIDTEADFIRLGVAQTVAARMGATYYSLRQLSEEKVLHIVRHLTAMR